MLTVKHLCKSFDDTLVLNDVSFSVNTGEVIALIGENGAGKTTLLELLTRKIKPDSGIISINNETIGYMAQNPALGTNVANSFPEIVEPWRRDTALAEVNLSDLPIATKTSVLSGGQKTRLALAMVLVQAPTIILLDEPTNNIDVEGLRWLKKFIKRYAGGIVLVSHDRSFINTVATGVMELHNGQMKMYGGNYELYKTQKDSELKTERERYEATIKEKAHVKRLLEAAQHKATQGIRKSRPTDNDKSQFDWHQNNVQRTFSGQTRALKSRLEHIDELEKPELSKLYSVNIRSNASNPNKLILQTKNLNKAYEQSVLENLSLELRGGERLLIQGSNGAGKTTLLKIIAGIIRPDSGDIKFGNNVRYAYFSQDVDGLNYALSALENLKLTDSNITDIYRSALSLGLKEPDLQKTPIQLSRGQQAKLSFTKLLLNTNDLLILDEPTNHLDIQTRECIELALQNYNGAIIAASHDEYFVNKLNISCTIKLSKL